MTSTFNPKLDVFMPIVVGRYLQETTDLDASESGAYLHLRMHLWINGPLPNDRVKLARIAKMTIDAWSIALGSVMHRFFLGSDGMYHHADLEAEKSRWLDKRQKAHDKAVKAACARWGKHKAKVGEDKEKKTDAPSIAQEMPYTVEVQVQKQKQKQPPPTPSAARRGIHGPNGSMRQASPRRNSSGASSPIAPGSAAGRAKGSKGENAVKAPRRHRQDLGGGVHPKNSGVSVVRQNQYVAPHPRKENSRSDPQKRDPRETAFKAEVFAYWKGLNPEHPNCPWDEHDWKALQALLIRVPDLSFTEFKRLLKNRAASEISASAHPFKWLRGLLEYSSGPLGPYGRPLRGSRVM